MIHFIKFLISSLKGSPANDDNEENKNKNKIKKQTKIDQDEKNIKIAKKVIYSLIILCAIAFVITMIVLVVKNMPSLTSSFEDAFDESKPMLDSLKKQLKT